MCRGVFLFSGNTRSDVWGKGGHVCILLSGVQKKYTHTQTYTDKQIHTDTEIHTQIHTNTQIHTDKYRDTNTDAS